jgi:hypothetical protein
MGSISESNGCPLTALRYIAQSYNHADSQASALRLVLTLNPDWEGPDNKIEFVRFTDGITNTVCSDLLYMSSERSTYSIYGLTRSSFSKS